MGNDLRGLRYLTEGDARDDALKSFVREELHYLDYYSALAWYGAQARKLTLAQRAFLACNDRFFLLGGLLGRPDINHPWLFARVREVEAAPDGHLDLWARYHYKSTIVTFAGIIQEVICDPELTVAIFSHTKPIARAFLSQIMRELEANEYLKALFPDVLYADPRRQSPRWSIDHGVILKRKGNPKEATIEAHGLVDGQPISRHYGLLVYDDVVTTDSVTTPEQILKTTLAWELSDNLGSHLGVRKWHCGTRYHFGDTYGVILERGVLKARIRAATEDGTLKGKPVFLSPARWDEVKSAQRSTVSAQMLLNPVAGSEATFKAQWFRPYEVRPARMNVYIMCDPSKGQAARSDRTAIAVIGVDQAGNKYLLDGVRHRMKLSERYGFLKQLWQYWSRQPGIETVSVGYERYGMQADLEVIEEWMERDKVSFDIEELSFPREGRHSKKDRVERLEPDLRRGKFHLPGVVFHPDIDGPATWSVEEASGKIVYRALEGLTRGQSRLAASGQHFRIVRPIKRLDEERCVYDLTRAFIEEALFFPFAPHDDLIDAASRIYDMKPVAASRFEEVLEPAIHPDA
jgi:hypothetical protein